LTRPTGADVATKIKKTEIRVFLPSELDALPRLFAWRFEPRRTASIHLILAELNPTWRTNKLPAAGDIAAAYALTGVTAGAALPTLTTAAGESVWGLREPLAPFPRYLPVPMLAVPPLLTSCFWNALYDVADLVALPARRKVAS
jgi:hypothetical protein